MSKQTIEALAAQVIAALEAEDHTAPGLQKATGLSEDHCVRALNYLKSKGRIENVKGLLHLRPAPGEVEATPESPAEVPAAADLASGQIDQITYVNLSQIRRDGGTQSRAQLDPETVERYIEEMARGDQFPPIELVYDGTDYWPWDGFHRLAATEQIDQDSIIDAYVRQGTRRDAILLAAGANAAHGLPRSADDKRRAVLALLNDEEWRSWSDRKIAQATRTYHGFVGKLRAELFPDGQTERIVERGDQTFTMKTGAINADRPYTVTADDRAALRKVLADGPVHKTQLERRTVIQTRAFVATLKAMSDDGEIVREGMMYRLQELPLTQTAEDANQLYTYLAEQSTPVIAARAANELDMEATAFTRAVNLLEADGRITRTKNSTGSPTTLAAIVPSPLEEESTPEPAHDDQISPVYREGILRDLAEGALNYHRLLFRVTGVGHILNHQQALVDELFRASLNSLAAEGRVRHTGSPDHLWALCDTIPELPVESEPPAAPYQPDTMTQLILNDLPIRQREMLLAVYQNQPVVKNAATRTALINRSLLMGSLQGYVGGGSIWDHMNLTHEGRRIAALLADVTSPIEEKSAPEYDNVTWDGTVFVDAIEQRAWHTPDGKRLVWIGRLESDKHYPWRATIYWRNPKTDDDVMFSAPGMSRLEAFRAARSLAARTIKVANAAEPPAFIQRAEAKNDQRVASLPSAPIEPDAEDSADPTPAQDGDEQREQLSFLAARNRIIDALNASEQPLTWGHLRSTLGQDYEESAVLDQVHTEMLKEGTLAEITEGNTRRCHFPEIIAKLKSDELPVRPGRSEHPRVPLSLDIAKSLIHDALRGSQRPLGRGELRKYAGIDEADRDVAEQAIDELFAKGVIAETKSGLGRRYHYADLVDKMMSPADGPVIPFDFTLITVTSAINLALKAPAPDWYYFDTAHKDELLALLRQAEDAAAALLARIEETWWPKETEATVKGA